MCSDHDLFKSYMFSFQSAKAMNLSHSYAGFARKSFGTPSYPSPLDRIRTGKGDRAAQLGLTPVTFLG